MDMAGKLIIVSGPSGVGKGTICREIVKRMDNVCLSVSATTRQKTAIETDGTDYHFLSQAEFEQGIDEGRFLEHAQVFGHWYGTMEDRVSERLAAGMNVLLEIDVQGAKQVKAVRPDASMIFIVPPNSEALEQRLNQRGRDSAASTEQRLDCASKEIAVARQCYEHMVINDDLQQAVNDVMQIIQGNSHST
jgi:guanylate kinase